jgi:hypothetical protein
VRAPRKAVHKTYRCCLAVPPVSPKRTAISEFSTETSVKTTTFINCAKFETKRESLFETEIETEYCPRAGRPSKKSTANRRLSRESGQRDGSKEGAYLSP